MEKTIIIFEFIDSNYLLLGNTTVILKFHGCFLLPSFCNLDYNDCYYILNTSHAVILLNSRRLHCLRFIVYIIIVVICNIFYFYLFQILLLASLFSLLRVMIPEVWDDLLPDSCLLLVPILCRIFGSGQSS